MREPIFAAELATVRELLQADEKHMAGLLGVKIDTYRALAAGRRVPLIVQAALRRRLKKAVEYADRN